jgi:hypothetical protein
MHVLVVASLVSVLALAGCKRSPPAPSAGRERATVVESTILRRVPVAGFDPDGEPEIRVMSDGALLIVFNFMPPSFSERNAHAFAHFDQTLAKALGVPVEWEDRETFRIRKPEIDTIEKARAFLAGYRKAPG